MPQKREGQTTLLNAPFGINVLAILIAGSVLGYLIWRFLWLYINDLDNESEEINALQKIEKHQLTLEKHSIPLASAYRERIEERLLKRK